MEQAKQIRLGLTYSDVLLVPKKTPLRSRSEADTKTRFTKNIMLNIPLVSANMATVTEHKMAIAMAREGGLGVVHQFNTVEEQVEEIKKVKRSTSYIVENPVIIDKDTTVRGANELMSREGVTSLLVMDKNELVGIYTRRDYLFEDDQETPIGHLMTPKDRLITAPYGIKLEEAKKILHKHRIEKLPLLKDRKLMGLITIQDIMKLEYWSNSTRDKKGRLRVGAAVGVKDTIERTEALLNAGADVIVLDVAHAHSEFVIERLKEIKEKFDVDVMVGNIATGEAAEEIIKAGADGLKVGIGPSPVCSTRHISGSGVPQLTAVMDVCNVAKKYNIPVCADGGLKYSGDITKAMAAGAETAFSGSFFAGTAEAPGFIIMKEGKRYKRYFGSASYESSHERKERVLHRKVKEKFDVYVEGVSNLVDYKGPVEGVITALVKGLHSGISYCGARNLRELRANAEFVQITSSGFIESSTRGRNISE